VSANQQLRESLKSFETQSIQVAYPAPEFCTDDGAMIAFAGLMRLSRSARCVACDDDSSSLAFK